MSTTDAARESARRGNGRFGVQRRSEPDPANAGLDVQEAPIRTWGEAVAHAEVLRAQGVDVEIDKGRKLILIRDDNGELHDPADGTPAFQGFYPNGTPMWISHWTNGKYHDPDDGTPAVQGFHLDGTPIWVEHWTNGEHVSEEMFPPPTGEA